MGSKEPSTYYSTIFGDYSTIFGGRMMAIEERVFIDGCPHCGDGIPAIVTLITWNYPATTNFVGDWDEDLKAACLKYGHVRIMACKKVGDE